MEHRRPDGRWLLSYFCRDGHRHRHVTKVQMTPHEAKKAWADLSGGPCPTQEKQRQRAEAAARREDLERQLREQRTFAAVADEYIRWAAQEKPRSLTFRVQAIKRLKEHFGDRSIGSIRDGDVEAYLEARRGQRKAVAAGGEKPRRALAPATLNRERAVLSHLFTWAADKRRRYATANPVKGTTRRPEPETRARALSPEEEARLFAALPARYKPIVTLALHTGLRVRELRTQRWADVDLEQRILTVTEPKSERPNRDLPLNDTARAVLRGLERKSPLVFPDMPRKFSDLFARYARRAGLPGVTAHCLRDTFITRVAPHVSPPTLLDLARHSDFRTTRRYKGVDKEGLRKAVAALDDAPRRGAQVAEVDGLLSEVAEKEGWRRRVGVEPTAGLLGPPLVLKTRRATGPNPPPEVAAGAAGWPRGF